MEKSGLEPRAPNRLADRKHSALSAQPNPHKMVIPTFQYGKLAELTKHSASDRQGDLVPQVSRSRVNIQLY